jgi:lactobin A/cerein 7B family class IIb bacteriocin
MQEALIKDVFADEEFVKRLLCLETPQEVQSAMSGKGIDLTLDQIVKIKELIVKRLDAGRELSEEELEDVTGGGILVLGLSLAATSLVLGLLVGGLAIGGTVGGAWLTDTFTNHTW